MLSAFDLLCCDGQDLRYSPLSERKHKLRSILPKDSERLMYCDHVDHDGESLFRLVCDNDLEGIVAKRKFDPYIENQATWLKIRNIWNSHGRSFSSESTNPIMIFHRGAIAPGLLHSRQLEEVEAGLEHSAEYVYTEYTDPRRDEWTTKILPALRKMPPTLLVKMSGLSSTTIKDTLAGRSRPYSKNQKCLSEILRKLRIT